MASSRKAAPEALPGSPVSAAPFDLDQRVAACLQRHLKPGARIVVGFSGGLDSTVLLHVLARLAPGPGLHLSAVHVHHGLSANADAWGEHCSRVCDELGLPLALHRVRVEPDGDGPEAAARKARYRVFSGLAVDALALAHHQDDQAETVLLQLLRGGGLKGVAAMPEARWLRPETLLLRPLLSLPRTDLEAWARVHRLSWIEDESNAQTRLARNALRHDILPLIERHFPGGTGRLARAAGQFAEAALLLDDLADADAGTMALSGELPLAPLADLPEPRARNLLRRFLERAGATLGQRELREALRQLRQARPDARLTRVFGGVTLKRFQNRVYALRTGQRAPSATEADGGRWQGEAELRLGESGWLRFAPATAGGVRLAPGRVRIRIRHGGELLRTAPGRPRRALKDLLREAAIPPWQRTRLPLIYLDDRLVWAAGIGADAEGLARPGEPGWDISWIPVDDGAPKRG